MAKLTPARKQYLDIKREVPNCLLFFRMGDFYELFDEDAVIAARELDITLTARQHSRDSAPIPMAGVPHHAVDGYVARLIEKGYHVAVCDQTSEPDGRGIVEREVTRVLTPGTLIEPSLLSDDQPNYLLALLPVGSPKDLKWQMAGIAYVDISTGEFATTQLEGENAAVLVLEELARLQPREVLIPELWAKHGVSLPEGIHLTPVQDWTFEHSNAEQAIKAQFHVHTLESYGLHNKPHATRACGAILQYLRTTQRNSLAQLSKITLYSTNQFMVLDQFTRRNLELTQTIRAGTAQGSVLGVLDRTQTAMGARQLRAWMNQPLLDINRLNARLNAVEALTQDEATRQALKAALQHVGDIERLVNRLLIGKANPRDLMQLAKSLQVVPQLRDEVKPYGALSSLYERLEPCEAVVDLISRALVDEPPAVMNDVGTIRAGFSSELDDILSNSAHARQWIAELEPKERRRSGIASLKVGFNKVFGYYIEITQANADRVPSDYIRKQTLANAERYITPELKEYESLVLNAEEEILACEKRIFAELCAHLTQYAEPMLRTAQAIALLDVLLALATVAVHEGYVRPTLTEDSDTLIIKGGRHPVVEKYLKDGARYTPNDTTFSPMSRIHIITGPNMSGKSTYIRQVAVITLMAQIGSFVPADEAKIGLVDRIFARIGAQDEIHAGQSTFMVEMVETARLLNGSTSRSLVVLDEIGRGTSTYDGIAIARAVIEYLHNHPRLNCRTLFATHYHELTELPNILPRTDNYRVAVAEQGEDVIFLHRVVAGGADRSYGVHVAQLAGLPRPVVERARQLLKHLEMQGSGFKPSKAPEATATQQLTLFSATAHPVVDALKSLDIDALSPIEALTRLYELKRMVQE